MTVLIVTFPLSNGKLFLQLFNCRKKLKLAELNVVGFKSFAKKTNVIFHDGMTAIVGPNGCGKSNIVDSIRWVMGEQKSGVLRSERMDNVIFAGSASAKPVGMAEVSLRIENTHNLLPVEYSEVLITRRLFRSGESQYLINGNQCRLKDINDLFMDTGMALGSYSVIELPQVERLLNGKQEERRKIFEEAAGITKYKIRRKASLRKLENTEKDLLRIEDILSEVEKTTRSLKRQVSKAEKYKEYSDELRDLEIRFAEYEFARMNRELKPLMTEFNSIRDEREKISTNLAQHETSFESLRHNLLDLEKQLTTSQQEYNARSHEVQKFEERILVNSERIRSLKELQGRYAEEKKNLNARVEELTATSDEAQYEFKNAKKELLKVQEEFEIRNSEFSELRKAFETKRGQLKESETEILRYTEELNRTQNEGERLKATEENLGSRIKQITEESDNHSARLEELAVQIKNTETNKDSLEQERAKKKNQHETLQKEIAEAKSSLENLQKSEMQDKNRIEVLENQAVMVKRLLESYQDYPAGVRHLATLPSEQFHTFGAIANLLHMPQEYRIAVAAALGDSATYLVVEDLNVAFNGIGLLQQEKKGTAAFIPVRKVSSAPIEHPEIEDLGVVGWANELVQCEPQYKSILDILLGNCLLVQDLETAHRLYKQLQHHKINLVTLNGEVLGHWGIVKGGSLNKKQMDFVGREEQLEELLEEIEQLKATVEKRRLIIVQRNEQIAASTSESEALAISVNNLDELISAKRLEFGQLQYEDQSTRELLKERQAEKENLIREMGKVDENLKNKSVDSQELLSKRQKASDLTMKFSQEQKELEDRLNSAAVVVQELQVKVAKLQSVYESRQRESDSLQSQIHDSKRMIQLREEETQRAIEEIGELEDINTTYRGNIEQIRESLSGIQKKISDLREQQYQVNVQVDEREKEIKVVRSRSENMSETVHQIELRVSELKMNIENLTTRITNEYEYTLGSQSFDDDMDIGQVREIVHDLKEKIKAFGPVNLLALKEYDKEKERLDFLTTQRDDLIKARKDLKETINVVNKTAREKFLGTFHEVRKNFSEVFRTFFEGGRADIVLREGDDPLEGDIDIFATPGGKRLSSLALLSGGEKSLTAVSLLFAIYLVKPSPFCIFDEVDAPLDDVNVKRFAHALQEYSTNTQFIVVTHNKLTMRAANQLYGVTMEDQGVSKVVSVKFDSAVELTEGQAVPAESN